MLELQKIFRRIGKEQEAQEIAAAFVARGEPSTLRWSIQRAIPLSVKARREGTSGNRPWRLALLQARLGETDDAFHWLREAVRQREGVNYVQVHPWLDSLRSDPRYGEILKTMNLAN